MGDAFLKARAAQGILWRTVGAIAVSAALALGGGACVKPLSLEGRRCACTPGFVCCKNTCVHREEASPQRCADPVDGAPSAAQDGASDRSLGPRFDGAAADGAVPGDTAADDGPPRDDHDGGEGTDARACNGIDGRPGCGCGAATGTVGARYFANHYLSGPSLGRIEHGLTFDWKDGSPDPAIGADYFSGVLSASLRPEITDSYTFFLQADDGARLWIDDEVVLDGFLTAKANKPTATAPGTLAASRALEAGRQYKVQIQFIEFSGEASVSLTWQRGGGPRVAIPSCLLTELDPPPITVCSWPPCVPWGADACGKPGGNGVIAHYYSTDPLTGGDGFAQVLHTDSDVPLALDWRWLPDEAPALLYNARFEGALNVPATGEFTFSLAADSPTTLSIGGRQVRADSEGSVSQEARLTVPLVAGPTDVPFTLEYRGKNRPPSSTFVQLRWKGPSTPETTVPLCRLFRPAGP
jgi:hypothetical protein